MQKVIKRLSVIALALCLLIGSMCLFGGCTEKVELPYSILERDPAKIGGENLTYSYDAHERILTVGAKGETIDFYTVNDSIGRTQAGNYIGVKIAAPKSITDFKESEIEYDGKIAKNGEFLVGKDYTVLRLKVTERERDFEIKIKWQKNAKTQVYKVHIADGTELEKYKN